MAVTTKPKNLRRLRLQVESTVPDRIEEIPAFLRTVIEELNDHHRRIEEAFADAAGHSGTVGLNADLDLQGHVVKNSGKAKHKDALPTLGQVDQVAGYATGAAVTQFLGALDLTDLPGADEVFDLDVPAVVTDLTLEWIKKAGWLARFGPPINVKRTLGYYVAFFNDQAGTVWMHPETGQVVATEALAERFVDATHYTTNLGGSEPSEPFLSGGVKVRVTARVKIKGKGKVRGTPLNYGSLVPPGGDPGLGSETFTGTSVPALPMALERTGVGGSGTNTATLFHLDAGASSEPNAYVGSGEDVWVLYVLGTGLAHLAPVGIVTAYDEINKAVTVTNLGIVLGTGFTYELHRGLALAGFSSTGHSTTTLKLDHSADSRVSTVTDHYKGMSLYVPYLAGGTQIQKVTGSSYVAPIHTLTFEPAAQQTAPGAAITNGAHYLLCKGAFGFQNINQTGIIAPAPMRVYQDTAVTPATAIKNVVEPIPPVDFNLTKAEIQSRKQSNSKLQYTGRDLPDAVQRFDAPTNVPMVTIRFRNLYRGGGSDGFSDTSYYVPAYKSTDAPTAVYSPTDFVPYEPDYQAEFPAV